MIIFYDNIIEQQFFIAFEKFNKENFYQRVNFKYSKFFQIFESYKIQRKKE